MHIYRSSSSQNTKRIAGQLAFKFAPNFASSPTFRSIQNRRGAVVIALTGDLGAGKTMFVQGFLRALRVRKKITSPTFVLMKRYALHNTPFAHLYHIDAYRLKHKKDLAALDFRGILRDPRNIVLIEWADRVHRAIPKNSVHITFLHGEREYERTIKMRGTMGR